MATIYNTYRTWCQNQETRISNKMKAFVPPYTIEGTLNSAVVSFAVNMIYYRGQVKSGLQAALLAAMGKVAQSVMYYFLNNKLKSENRDFISYCVGNTLVPLAGQVLPIPIASRETVYLSGLSLQAYAVFNRNVLHAFPLIVMMKRA